VHDGEPVTPEDARLWPSTKPVIVAVSGGFGEPNGRDRLSAVTVSGACATVTELVRDVLVL
jgi:hypothetical protein